MLLMTDYEKVSVIRKICQTADEERAEELVYKMLNAISVSLYLCKHNYIPRQKSGIYWIQLRRRCHRRNFLAYAITQKWINIFFKPSRVRNLLNV